MSFKLIPFHLIPFNSITLLLWCSIEDFSVSGSDASRTTPPIHWEVAQDQPADVAVAV